MSNLYKSAPLSTGVRHIKKIFIKDASVPTPEKQVRGGDDHAVQVKRHEQELVSLQQAIEQARSELALLMEQKQHTELELEDMKQQAETDIRNWWTEKEAEVEQMLQQAADDGRKTGEEEGLRLGQAQYETKLQELKALMASAYEEKERIIASAEPFLLSLSVRMAGKIINRKLGEQETQIYMDMIQQGLQHMKEGGTIIVEVSPDIFARIKPSIGELEELVNSGALLKVIPEPKQSGCIIHTPGGSYNISIDQQLSELKKAILARYEEGLENGTA